MIDCVSILAGGGGTRLWPASTQQRPKQFMAIASQQSLLQQALLRSWRLEPRLGVFVICNQQYQQEILREVNALPPEWAKNTYILPEPEMRNTATALFYANQLLEQLAGPEAVQLVQTSDHLIGCLELPEISAEAGESGSFAAAVRSAAALAQQQRIVVFGLQPKYPATGYGYIERGAELDRVPGGRAYDVLRFTEKPDLATAQEFVASARFYWNSGMFCYAAGLFRQELCAATPAIPAALAAASSQLKAQLERRDGAIVLPVTEQIKAAYGNCQNISVDYAVMEKSRCLGLLAVHFDWSDIGSWDALAELEASSQPTVEVGQCSGNFVRSSLPVALCDVRDLLVVQENGVLLICQKGHSEQVKQARQLLQQQTGQAW